MCEFMNKKGFSRHISIPACASFPDLPFHDGHKLVVCTNSVICSVTSGVFTAESVCAGLLRRLLLGSVFSQHISITSTQTRYVHSFMAQI